MKPKGKRRAAISAGYSLACMCAARSHQYRMDMKTNERRIEVETDKSRRMILRFMRENDHCARNGAKVRQVMFAFCGRGDRGSAEFSYLKDAHCRTNISFTLDFQGETSTFGKILLLISKAQKRTYETQRNKCKSEK